VDEKGSEYILAHTGPRDLCQGGVGRGLIYPFGKGPGQKWQLFYNLRVFIKE